MKLKGDGEKWIVCRVCLKQPKTGLQLIFHERDDMDLTTMILDCGGVPIVKFDHYPDKICESCLTNLKIAHNFRTTCQRSYHHLCRLIPPVYVETIDERIGPLGDQNIVEKEEPPEEFEVKEEFNGMSKSVFAQCDRKQGETRNHLEVASHNLENEIDSDTSDDDYLPLSKRVSSRRNAVKSEKNKIKKVPTSNECKEQKIDSDTTTSGLTKDQNAHLLICDICGVKYLTQRRLKAHLKLHKNPKPPKPPKETSFICEICGNIYSSKKPLNEHIKLHTGIKPHECEICGYAFVQLYQLTRHMNKHTGNRPYKCNYCPSAFGDRSSRDKHHRTHTNERPFGCDVCGKAFPYANSLKIHKMIHTGEKPYVCDICGKAFPQTCKLRNHIRIHAKKKMLETKEKASTEVIKEEKN